MTCFEHGAVLSWNGEAAVPEIGVESQTVVATLLPLGGLRVGDQNGLVHWRQGGHQQVALGQQVDLAIVEVPRNRPVVEREPRHS